MKVSELIRHLQGMPSEADVICLFDDGFGREPINRVWLAVEGHVVLADSEWCVHKEDRPQGATNG